MLTSISRSIYFLIHLERKLQLYILIVLFGLAWIGFGLMLLMQSAGDQVVIPDASSDQVTTLNPQITVDVSGAVTQPGLYQVVSGARVGDALAKAGGLHPDADTVAINQKLNFAEKVVDGQKIYVPFQSLQPNPVVSPSQEIENPRGLISLNQATSTELETLPGIGEKKASDLIAGRPYSAIDDAQSIAKVGDEQWAEIKKKLSL